MSKAGKFSQQPPATVSSTVVVPSMACDCHGHIFPDAEIYPTVNETMPLAPVELFLDVHTQLGFQRGVLVQGGAYKFDNRAMLEALDLHPGQPARRRLAARRHIGRRAGCLRSTQRPGSALHPGWREPHRLLLHHRAVDAGP